MPACPFVSTSRYLTAPVYRGHTLDVKRYAARMDEQPARPAHPPAGSAHAAAGPARPAALARDEVDDLVAAWHSERPDLDVEPLQVLSRVSRLARHLDRARRAAFAGHGLELWEFDVLSALRRQGAPYQLTPGALLHATLVTSGTMTNRVDQLAEAGLVRREPNPQDRRGVLVSLTPAGLDRVDSALADPAAQRGRPAQRAHRCRPPHPGRPAPDPPRPAGRVTPHRLAQRNTRPPDGRHPAHRGDLPAAYRSWAH